MSSRSDSLLADPVGARASAGRKRRLLVLTSRLPYPVVGGDRLRIHRLCRELATHLELTLLSLCETEQELAMDIPRDGVFSRVERVLLPKWRSWLNCLIALPGGTPLQVAYYQSSAFRRRVGEMAAEHDGVLAHLIRTGEYVRRLPGPKFLEMTDAISLNYRRVRSVGARTRKLQSLVYAVEERRLGAYERDIVADFDAAVLVSDVDRDHLFGGAGRAPGNVFVCSNGVDVEEMPFQYDGNGRDIVFIGNLHSVQNLDAAHYFANDVLPIVRSRAPDVRFRIVGRIRPGDASVLARIDGVDVTGEVDSVPLAVRGAGVGVCPLRLGAGVQNKILEYMALGIPSVTTTVGLEGLAARVDKEILCADDREEFASAVLRLLRDRAASENIANAARAHVVASHSWAARVEPVVAHLARSLTGEQRRDTFAPRVSSDDAGSRKAAEV